MKMAAGGRPATWITRNNPATPLAAAGLCAALAASPGAQAQTTPLVNLCTGLSVTLPVLQPVPSVTSGLGALLDTALGNVIGGVNLNLRDALSGRNIGLTAVDQNGNIVSAPARCNVGADNFTIIASRGITIGGGRIDGLGGTANAPAVAGEANSIAFGNGAGTSASATGAIAIGLRGTVGGIDGLAIGRDAAVTGNTGVGLGAATSVTAAGGVALGAGSTASRAGLAGAAELFTGTVVASTNGAVSVGSAGGERQIANVAGGTAATDAVNLRQLRIVGGHLATALGGGSAFDPATGAYAAPSYTIQGARYSNVGSALGALDSAIASAGGGTIGLLQQNPISRTITLGATANGTLVDVAGTAGARRISGVGAGSGATDAVNVAQLNSAIAGIGSSTPTVASENSRGAAPPVASGLRSVAVGYGSTATAADTFSVGASGGERRIVNVAAGTLAPGSTDAVNGAQLLATNAALASTAADAAQANTRLAAGLGGGAAYDAAGKSFTFPAYTIRGANYVSVGAAFAAIDTALGAAPVGGGGGGALIAATSLDAGRAPIALGDDSLAAGFDAAAGGTASSAIGNASTASGANASSLGARSTAAGTGSTAIGADSAASGDGSSAVGSHSRATAGAATAIGMSARADAEGATAIGANAAADHANAIAIGRDVATTRINQAAIGNGQSTYTLAGLASAASRAAQSGPLSVVTTDMAGNLATARFDPNAWGDQMEGIARYATEGRTEARRGIAAAMSMTSASMPSAAGRTSWAMNTATFQGEWAGGFGLAHRFDMAIPIAVTASYSIGGGNTHGVRVGLAGEF